MICTNDLINNWMRMRGNYISLEIDIIKNGICTRKAVIYI